MRKSTAPKPPSFAALVQQFFTVYLVAQRAVSPRTVACYRDALMLFLDFASGKLGKAPTAMQLADIQPDLILAFLDHLEHGRKNAVRSRNLRLTALRAFLKFAGRRDVTSLHDVERALAVPMKRFERPMLGFLNRAEMLAVLGQPEQSWSSQRDHLLLAMLYNTGARVSEIIGVRVVDVVLDGRRVCSPARQGTQAQVYSLVGRHRRGDTGVAAVEPSTARRGRLAAQPRRTGNVQIQRCAAPGYRRQACGPRTTQPAQKAGLPSHAAAHECHASVAVRRAVQRDRAVAWAREHDDHASLR